MGHSGARCGKNEWFGCLPYDMKAIKTWLEAASQHTFSTDLILGYWWLALGLYPASTKCLQGPDLKCRNTAIYWPQWCWPYAGDPQSNTTSTYNIGLPSFPKLYFLPPTMWPGKVVFPRSITFLWSSTHRMDYVCIVLNWFIQRYKSYWTSNTNWCKRMQGWVGACLLYPTHLWVKLPPMCVWVVSNGWINKQKRGIITAVCHLLQPDIEWFLCIRNSHCDTIKA